MPITGVHDFGLFCLAVLLLNATPGPDTAFIVGRSLAQGRLAGLVSALGISAGCCVHALAAAFGLSALLAASSGVFLAIKLAGGAYLIFLGLRMLLSRPVAARPVAQPTEAHTLRLLFGQAMLTNVLNPKVILFFLSFFPQFVSPSASHRTVAFLILGTVFLLMSTCWGVGTALLAGTLAQRMDATGRCKRWLERVVGAGFIGLGARLALART